MSNDIATAQNQKEITNIWQLDPKVTFLNHGSFGACPRAIAIRQNELRRELEAEPVNFMARRVPDLLDASRARVAQLVGARSKQIAFVTNATSAVNAVLRSLEFGPGDEILTTDHVYGGCRNAVEFIADRTGAKVVYAHIPFPIDDPSQATEAILAAVTPNTKLALIDHITSPTALVLPIAEIVSRLREKGVETLVDGAHAPGMVDLQLDKIGAAFYTGNCHKWLCTPKGAAFLHVREDFLSRIHALTVSFGYTADPSIRSRYLQEFDWPGTMDFTPWLCVGDAIEYLDTLLPGGLAAISARNHKLALEAQTMICGALQQKPACPDSMIGTMAAFCLPDMPGLPPSSHPAIDALSDLLRKEHGIVVPVNTCMAVSGRILRISVQLYNNLDHYLHLGDVLITLIR